ncbi:UNVERIFIED_CONTAM: hypothetical protein HDU68_008889 [Siphonaria sp. JEL0065]|nr:hypothetical protein HDU68_008889 [Siphonaria sp. JEL0065]
MSESVAAIHRLPMVVLQRIGLHLSAGGVVEARVLVRLALVQRSWTEAALGALYRCPPLVHPDAFEQLLVVLPRRVPTTAATVYAGLVQELDLCGAAADNVYIGDLDGALQSCKHSLRILRLGSVFHMSNMIVQSIATHCHVLMQLELPGCPVSDAFIPLLTKQCAKLLRLDAAFTNLSVGSLVPVVRFANSLLELDLSECREPEDGLDLSPMPDIRRPLKFLNLRNTQITDPLLSFTIAHCPFLEILILESCSKVTDESLAPLFSSCPNLRSLDVSFCDAVSDVTVNAITRFAAASTPNELSLEELYLSGCDSVTPISIHKMVAKAKRLELLVMDGCEQVSSSYVKEYAIDGDDVECTLERDGILRLAQVVPPLEDGDFASGVLSPPMSPVMQKLNMMMDLKVEVSYGEQSLHGDMAKGGRSESGFAKTEMMKSPVPPPASMLNIPQQTVAPAIPTSTGISVSMDEKEAAEYKALQESAANSATAGQRRQSKTLRHRKSLLGLSARAEEEDVDEMQEAAKQERAEKIKEKRRSAGIYSPSGSHTNSRSSMHSANPSLSNSTLALHERFLAAASIPRPASESFSTGNSLASLPEDAEASKAAFLAAAAAKGLKISAPSGGSPDPSPKPLRKRPSSILRADVAAFIPTSPPPENSALDENAYVAPATPTSKENRRISVGVPSGPPPPDARMSWSAPNGIAQNSVVSAVAAPAPTQQTPSTITTPTGETGVLLFSGRASRMSMNRESASTPTPQNPTATTTASAPTTAAANGDEEAPIVIASGRRRTRGVSIIDDSKAAVAVSTFNNPASAQNPPPPQQTENTLPSWATAPVPPPVTAQPMQWGTDPTAWNNPAQLTSASSTWSQQQQQQQQFADPWTAASAGSSQQSQHQSSSVKGEPATSVLGPAPVINSLDPWAAPPASAANSIQPPTAVVANAAAAVGVNPSSSPSWQQKAAGAPGSVVGSIPPPRPSSVNARFGGVGSGGISNLMSTPAGLLANPPGLGGMASRSNASVSGAPVVAPPKEKNEGFVYSVQNRGRLLLKLKIETKIGGEQMLAVHEYDDPQQLATEFVNFWELQAFKDPLVRLIAVRKTNVLRNRGALNA